MPKQPVALIILDGFAFRDEQFGNAVAQAKKPNFDRYWNQLFFSFHDAWSWANESQLSIYCLFHTTLRYTSILLEAFL